MGWWWAEESDPRPASAAAAPGDRSPRRAGAPADNKPKNNSLKELLYDLMINHRNQIKILLMWKILAGLPHFI